jgi:DNA polymerase-3 subunit gamma/tau
VQLCYQIAVQGREDLPLAPDEHAGFLMTLLRMPVFRPDGSVATTGSAPAAGSAPARSAPAVASSKPPAAKPTVSSGAKPTAFDGDWPSLAQKLPLAGGAKELARNAELRTRTGNTFELVIAKSLGHLAGDAFREKLQAALAAQLGAPVKVQVSFGETSGVTAAAQEAADKGARRAEATKAVQGDRFVQDLVNLFDGRVVDSTIREKQR